MVKIVIALLVTMMTFFGMDACPALEPSLLATPWTGQHQARVQAVELVILPREECASPPAAQSRNGTGDLGHTTLTHAWSATLTSAVSQGSPELCSFELVILPREECNTPSIARPRNGIMDLRHTHNTPRMFCYTLPLVTPVHTFSHLFGGATTRGAVSDNAAYFYSSSI